MFLKIILVGVKTFYQSCANSEFSYLKLRFSEVSDLRLRFFQEILEVFSMAFFSF